MSKHRLWYVDEDSIGLFTQYDLQYVINVGLLLDIDVVATVTSPGLFKVKAVGSPNWVWLYFDGLYLDAYRNEDDAPTNTNHEFEVFLKDHGIGVTL